MDCINDSIFVFNPSVAGIIDYSCNVIIKLNNLSTIDFNSIQRSITDQAVIC